MSTPGILPQEFSLQLPQVGYPLMSDAAFKILEQVYGTWSKVWIRKDPLKAKIWYSQVGEDERWIPLNGTQARVARAAVGHGFLDFVDLRLEADGEWSLFRMSGEGNRAVAVEQSRRIEQDRRQELWVTHLHVCKGCRGFLDGQSQIDIEEMRRLARQAGLLPIVPDDAVACEPEAPGTYYLRLIDWRR